MTDQKNACKCVHFYVLVVFTIYSVLMSKHPSTSKVTTSKVNSSFRSALGQYLIRPHAFPNTLKATDEFVLIRDMYPKARIHWLILPRKYTNLRPFEAFEDIQFLNRVKEFARSQAEEAELQLGKEGMIKVGVHAVPSMDNLHIHVISRDMCSDKMKNAKHYNSFNTNFFVELSKFPVDDKIIAEEEEADLLKGDLICWRCGRTFGRKFAALKGHLDEESKNA
jgi:aprataxin